MAVPKEFHEQYTYADYLTWPGEEKWEIINGIPYNMAPAPSRGHQKISLNLERIIDAFLTGKGCEMYHAPFDVRLPGPGETEKTASTVVQPDILVVCDPSKLDDKGCLGAPDLIVEILSESTASRDMKEKLFLYEKHGIKEYWIVDFWDKTVKVYILNKNGAYDFPSLYAGKDTLSAAVLPGLNINLAEVFTGF